MHSDGLGLAPRPRGFLFRGFSLLLAWFRLIPQPAGEARRWFAPCKENQENFMSQPGYIYVLYNSSANGVVKIGKTQRNPDERARELSSATGVPTPFIVVYQAYFNDCDKAEMFVHTKLERYRVANNREFFQVAIHVAVDSIIEAKNYYAKSENILDLSDRENALNETAEGGELLESLTDNDESQNPGQEMYVLGSSYYFGTDDTIQDFNEAFNYYQKAARLGYADAFLQMGRMCRDGEGRNVDNKRALECFKEAIKHGDDDGWAEMANIFYAEGHHENEAKCWNKYFSSDGFLISSSTRSSFVYDYVNHSIEQNKPLEHKDQIRSVKNQVLYRINSMVKDAKNSGYVVVAEKFKKVADVIEKL